MQTLKWIELKILGHTIEVWLAERLWSDGDELYGQWDSEAKRITLSEAAVHSGRLIETLFHELTHATVDLLDTDLTKEEQLCRHMGGALAQALTQYLCLPPVLKLTD